MVQSGFIDISDEYLTGLSDCDLFEKCVPQSLILQSASPDILMEGGVLQSSQELQVSDMP